VTSIILVFLAFVAGALILRKPATVARPLVEPFLVTSEVSPEPVS
jgi:hypothetical protein